jgi:hypothetical protein
VLLVERLLHDVQLTVLREALDGRDLAAVRRTASTVHDFTDSPSSSTVHAPQEDVSQPTFVPVSPSCSRRKYTSSWRGSTSASRRSPLTVSDT